MTRASTPTLQVLRNPLYRKVWISSIIAHFGNFVLTVGAAWSMATLTSSTTMVALVQTAVFGPYLLFGLLAGAVADIFDKRHVILIALAFRTSMAGLLTLFAALNILTPMMLLSLCFLFGIGSIGFAPAWQSSIAEQVSPEELSNAVALNSVSYNVARSAGPALGGMIVAAAGALAAFATATVSMIPIGIIFFMWRRPTPKSDHPRERVLAAIGTSIRYIIHTPPLKNALLRSFSLGLTGGLLAAFAPLVARDMLGGNASVYGMLLGSMGLGAVTGALFAARLKGRIPLENQMSLFCVGAGLGTAVIGFSTTLPLAILGYFLAGAMHVGAIALMNISVQVRSPQWINARALASFQALVAGGAALGAWGWGLIAEHIGLELTIFIAAFALTLLFTLRYFKPIQEIPDRMEGFENDRIYKYPDNSYPLTTGPVTIEIYYNIPRHSKSEFLEIMSLIKRSRLRNGAQSWMLYQDEEDLETWIQSFSCKNWGEFIRLRSRITATENELAERANALQFERLPRKVSLRWQH